MSLTATLLKVIISKYFLRSIAFVGEYIASDMVVDMKKHGERALCHAAIFNVSPAKMDLNSHETVVHIGNCSFSICMTPTRELEMHSLKKRSITFPVITAASFSDIHEQAK